MTVIAFTILGQAFSKANSRKIVDLPVRGQRGVTRRAVIKSKEALAYEASALQQIPPRCRVELRGPVGMRIRMYYATQLPDMDESLVLDILQTRFKTRRLADGRPVLDAKGVRIRDLVQRGVYLNDRQVRDRHTTHHIDKVNPRVELEAWPLEMQQASMFEDDEQPVFATAEEEEEEAAF